MSVEIVHTFMNLRDQIKIYHWQTKSYSRHIASDDLVKKLDTNIDQFVEVYIGKYGRPKFSGKTKVIHLTNHSNKDAEILVDDAIAWLSNLSLKLDKKKDSDLLNIKDTIIADLNQVKYLFTLKS
jgi:hypothetical protein